MQTVVRIRLLRSHEPHAGSRRRAARKTDDSTTALPHWRRRTRACRCRYSRCSWHSTRRVSRSGTDAPDDRRRSGASGETLPDSSGFVIIAVGDNYVRETLVPTFGAFAVAVHPTAVVGRGVDIGEGSVVMAGAVINSGARIGRHCIVNTRASVDHDCVVCDFAHVAPGATLGGTVYVGRGAMIGLGANVSHGVHVGDYAVVGAGSTASATSPSRSSPTAAPHASCGRAHRASPTRKSGRLERRAKRRAKVEAESIAGEVAIEIPDRVTADDHAAGREIADALDTKRVHYVGAPRYRHAVGIDRFRAHDPIPLDRPSTLARLAVRRQDWTRRRRSRRRAERLSVQRVALVRECVDVPRRLRPPLLQMRQPRVQHLPARRDDRSAGLFPRFWRPMRYPASWSSSCQKSRRSWLWSSRPYSP